MGSGPQTISSGLREEAEKIRKELNVPPKAHVIFSPRNFAPYWGIETIIQSIPMS